MKSHPRNCAHQEVELKLCLPGADPAVLAKRLARTPALARRKPSQQSLTNIYFDTPDQVLRQQGVALRLRRVGSAADPQWLQTLKTSTGEISALSQRGEWESTVAGPALEPAALERTPWSGIDPDGCLFAALVPCFVTRFKRTLWLVRRRDGSAVEVALDIGHIEAHDKRAPICELELELKAGEPSALFDLARQLAQGVAVLPVNQSKAERGFLLAQDALERPQRAKNPQLVLPLSRPELAQRVLREMFAQFSQNLADLRNPKSTTGMDVLNCQTPQMNEKQLWIHLLAYNVIRLLMAQAACIAGVDPRELSFKHTVQLWTEWVSRGLSATKDCARLFTLIAQCRVGNRSGRIEPRMRKRRPKPYPWLKVPRAQARRKIKIHGHDWEPK